jgi:hypothetical protein
MANSPKSLTPMPQEKIKELLDTYPDAVTTVNNSITNGLGIMCGQALTYSETVKAVADSYVKNVFPFFRRTPEKQMWDIETEPAPELQEFWSDVSEVSGYEFGNLDKYLLSVEGGMPLIFLNTMKIALNSQGKKALSDTYLEPIRAAIKQERYDYSSIDELIGKQAK